MSVNFQPLTGLSLVTTDDLTNNGTLTTDKFTMLTGAHSGYVLTSDDIGSASWQALTTSLNGDVTGPFQTNVVQTVGGSTASNIHLAELLANAANSLGTPNTIVKLNASGNFAANMITSNLTGNVTGNATTATKVTMAGDVQGASNSSTVSTLLGGIITFPIISSILINNISAQGMSNKTLVTPVIDTIKSATGLFNLNGSGTITVPSVTDTLTGKATTDTFTNKTITGTTNNIDANSIRNGSTWVVPFSGAAPATNNVLSYNGTNAVWVAPTSTSSVTMGGDVTGNSATSTVTKINGVAPVSTATASTVALRDASAGCAFGPLTSTTLNASGNITLSGSNGAVSGGGKELCAIASANSSYFTDSIAGDSCYRNGGGSLRFGTSSGNSQLSITPTGVNIQSVNTISITLATNNGTPSLLNYYEEFTLSTTFTGCGFTTAAATILVRRIGKIVSIFNTTQLSGTSVASGIFASNTALTARFCPGSGFSGYAQIIVNGAPAVGNVLMNPSGVIQILLAPPSGNYPAGNTQGFYPWSASWCVA
jgi:hypothetical protein